MIFFSFEIFCILQVFKEKNIDLSKNLVASCQTGMTATSLAFALEIIGIKDVPVYYVSLLVILLYLKY